MLPPSFAVSARRASQGAIFVVLLGFAAARTSTALNVDLVASSDLGFGRIVATGAAGSVSVTPSGARSAKGGVALGNPAGVGPASFSVTGDPNASYNITLPDLAQLTAGPDTMTVDGFTSSPSGSGNLGAAGRDTVYLGATLHVGAVQRPGSYAGSFIVIVSYD